MLRGQFDAGDNHLTYQIVTDHIHCRLVKGITLFAEDTSARNVSIQVQLLGIAKYICRATVNLLIITYCFFFNCELFFCLRYAVRKGCAQNYL